ncbi:mitochondrial import inner membrane translocase subunit tim54 [Trapelia coarctata]|nr:mitochondrial import inner membrane translocase subunit tim54 [Trapelia coarctata]
MADDKKPTAEAAKPPVQTMKPSKPEGNPALRMMGLPQFRAKLPSRNWLIFLSITGSFTTALLYDRHHKKKAQKKWCDLVSHLAREPMSVNQLPRKFTIFLSAPPGDGLRSAREYFTEYVKPVLVAGAVEWEVVEGRREGDVRAGLAERVRKIRRKNGEKAAAASEETEEEDMVEGVRQRAGIRPSDEIEGDLVIGRHTWKEYVRGLQEGWLGPLEPPPEPPPVPASGVILTPQASTEDAIPDLKVEPDTAIANDDASPTSAITETPAPAVEAPKKPIIPTPPYISPSDYPSSTLAPTIPRALTPAVPLPFPHILGFLNTPIRMYRYLTQRHLADKVGGAVADMVLARSTRPWEKTSNFTSSIDPDWPMMTDAGAGATVTSGTRWEQQSVHEEEEKEWHKSARAGNPPDQEGKERVWQEDMTIDERIGERMTTFVDSMAEEEKAKIIADEDAIQLAAQAQKPGWLRSTKIWTGWSEDDEGRVKGWEHGLVGNESE